MQIRKRKACNCRTLLLCGLRRPTDAAAAFVILGVIGLVSLQRWHLGADGSYGLGIDGAASKLVSPSSPSSERQTSGQRVNAAATATAADTRQNAEAKKVSLVSSTRGAPIKSSLIKKTKTHHTAAGAEMSVFAGTGKIKDAKTRAIPHILTFTYKSNILETKTPKLLYDNVQNTINKYKTLWKEPDAPVRFLDDTACQAEIEIAEPRLIPHFLKEEQGKFKADVCRVAALYNTGGWYFDTDLRVLEAVHLANATVFGTVASPQGKSFFQAWLVSAPHHVVLKRALETMWAYYEGTQELRGKNLGCSSLKLAFDAVDESERGEVRLLRELKLKSPNVYPDVPRQEGKGCCCNYVVHDEFERRVYFFSRIVGAGLYCEATP